MLPVGRWDYYKLVQFLLYFADVSVPIIKSTKDVEGDTVVVKWKKIPCPPINMYTVYYRELMPYAYGLWKSVDVPQSATTYSIQLTCHREYEIAVTANGERPFFVSSNPPWVVKTGQGKLVDKIILT